MRLHRAVFSASELKLIASAESFHDVREPPLSTGNFVRLNGGGPNLMVVDVDGATTTVAWRDADGRTREAEFPRACVHRIPVA